jgi:hypothetical protein
MCSGQERLEISGAALSYLAQQMKEMLLSREPEKVRGILRQSFKPVELGKEKLTLHYIRPLVQSQSITGVNPLPPRGFTSNPTFSISSGVCAT